MSGNIIISKLGGNDHWSLAIKHLLTDFFVYSRSEQYVVKGNSVVVAQNALVRACASWVLALQNMMELVVLPELLEILEVLYLRRIITKNFVEEEVTILESPHVHGYKCDSFLEEAVIGEKQVRGNCDARDEDLGFCGELLWVVYEFEGYVGMVLKKFGKSFGLVFITQQTQGDGLVFMVVDDATGGGFCDIAEPHHGVCIDIA